MKNSVNFKATIAIAVSILLLIMAGPVWSLPEAPLLSLEDDQDQMTIRWTTVADSQEYLLSYAPYPDATYIETFSAGSETEFTFTLWQGAAFYVAVQAKNDQGLSEYSNISYFEYDELSYPVVDTGQSACYDADGAEITCPGTDEAFAGQDAQYAGSQPSYTDNGDGTITDNVTGLVWQQTPADSGLSYQEAQIYCESLELGGYDDWRIPTTKELFSATHLSRDIFKDFHVDN